MPRGGQHAPQVARRIGRAEGAAPGTRTALALKQPQQRPRQRRDRRAGGELAVHVIDVLRQHRRALRQRRCRAEHAPVGVRQQPGRVIRRPADHHAVHVRQVRQRLVEVGNAAVDDDLQLRPQPLQPVHRLVTQRRNLPVLARREPVQPGLARVHREVPAASASHRFDELEQVLVAVRAVDADAALHRHRHGHRRLHRRHAVTDQRGFRHQARAKAPGLHPVRRAADVEVDLVVTEIRPDARRLRQLRRVTAAKLQGHRMFGRAVREQIRRIAAQQRLRRDHLRVQQRAARNQAMQEPRVAIGPVHHRRHRQAARQRGRTRGGARGGTDGVHGAALCRASAISAAPRRPTAARPAPAPSVSRAPACPVGSRICAGCV